MPKVNPPTTTIEALDEKAAIARAASLVNYGFWFGADGHNMAQMRQAVKRTDVAGIKVFMGSSTGSLLVDSADALCKILENIPAPVAVHAEDEAIIRANRQDAVARYRHDKQVPLTEHRRIRSTQACRAAVRTAVDAQGWCGGQLHVLHISSEGELAEMEGTDTIAEVCVGHLWFTDDDMKTLGAKIKVNPAIKTDSDRRALRRAVRQGQIAIINTDHAPHLLADKKGGALVAASGMPIIQFGLPMMFELADRGVFTHQQVVACMCHNPAKLLGIEGRGVLVPGYYADIAVVYPDAEYTVQDADVASLCGWTPMAGQTLHNMVVATFVNGQLAYSQATDTYEAPDAAMPLKFTRR